MQGNCIFAFIFNDVVRQKSCCFCLVAGINFVLFLPVVDCREGDLSLEISGNVREKEKVISV